MRITRLEPSSAVVAAVSLVLFCILTAVVLGGRTAVADRHLIEVLRSGATPLFTTAMLATTLISGKLAIPAAMLFTYGLYRSEGRRAAWYYVAACLTAQLLNLILKYGIHRARPHGISPKLTAAGGPSYPSADVMMAIVVFGLGAWLLTRTMQSGGRRAAIRLVVVFYLIAAAIARVYLGAHWPSDVLGAAFIGVACSAFWTASALRDTHATPLAPLR